MSEHGAALQTCNQELVKYIEKLKSKQREIGYIIRKEEAEKNALLLDLSAIQKRVNELNKKISHDKGVYESYKQTISETEEGFKKILESSQTLLEMTKIEMNKNI